MKILVQKFGGTSVSTAERREMLTQRVLHARAQGYKVVVVVSAMGRRGEPYATDTLLSLGDAAFADLAAREKDLLMSCGETISAVVVAGFLQAKGLAAQAFTGAQAGILTDSRFGSASCLHVDPRALIAALEQDIVPVVTGFQGVDAQGAVTTLGRGGSDTTAALLGVALKAELVEIYTDVDGIMTADPRVAPKARVLHSISYDEVYQMADNGAGVIHPRAVDVAMRGSVPLLIRNALSDAQGTLVTHPAGEAADARSDEPVANISALRNRTQATLRHTSPAQVQEILHLLADSHISIDLINLFPDSAVFTVSDADTPVLDDLFREKGVEYSLLSHCAKVSAIGERMRGIPGVMARVLTALQSQGIEVLQTADSHMTIACLVRGDATDDAVRALHEAFHLDQ